MREGVRYGVERQTQFSEHVKLFLDKVGPFAQMRGRGGKVKRSILLYILYKSLVVIYSEAHTGYTYI